MTAINDEEKKKSQPIPPARIDKIEISASSRTSEKDKDASQPVSPSGVDTVELILG